MHTLVPNADNKDELLKGSISTESSLKDLLRLNKIKIYPTIHHQQE